jgi:lipoate-protein ligase A
VWLNDLFNPSTVNFIDLTFPNPEHNLACDEALLDWCEEADGQEILRVWESPKNFVVLGYSNKTATEVRLDACRAAGVPVLRRCSGGGAVLQGPGCLNFSLILKIPPTGPLTGITETTRFILDRHAGMLRSLLDRNVGMQGLSDLTVGPLKFSGNAQRRKRRYLLFHGTFLLDFDIPLVERLLPLPSRQPDYRRGRPHLDFLTNLRTPTRQLKETLRNCWDATEPLRETPDEQIDRLAKTKYSSADWTFKF